MNRARTTECSAFISRAWLSHWYPHSVHFSSLSFSFEPAFLFAQPSLQPPPEMAGAWVSTYSLNVEGFPKILHATLQKLGVNDRPEYEGREYEEHGTERLRLPSTSGSVKSFPTSLKPRV